MALLPGYGAAESASYYFLLEFVLYIIGRKEGRGISSQGKEMRKIDKKIYAKLAHGHDNKVKILLENPNDITIEGVTILIIKSDFPLVDDNVDSYKIDYILPNSNAEIWISKFFGNIDRKSAKVECLLKYEGYEEKKILKLI